VIRNRVCRPVAALIVLLGLSAVAFADWQVTQNDPDPFCNDPESPEFSGTWFTIWGEPTVEITFEIWDPDTTGVLVRQQMGEVGPGSYILVWYGTDGMDTVLPETGYPYRIVVAEPGEGAVTFGGWRVCHVSCETPVDPETWGRIKSLYRTCTQSE